MGTDQWQKLFLAEASDLSVLFYNSPAAADPYSFPLTQMHLLAVF